MKKLEKAGVILMAVSALVAAAKSIFKFIGYLFKMKKKRKASAHA
jgi:hypothetical protein